MSSGLILLTGASGYVGGRLRRALEQDGYPLRCLSRHPGYLIPRVAPTTEVVAGDVGDRESLDRALQGVETAYYLVHSMGSSGDFRDHDRVGAANFAAAARAAGVRKMVYLGGLGEGPEGDLSPHLQSRQEVGRILRESGVPTIELRASIIIGSGSLSFEMIRSLVEKLPVMVTPRWVRLEAQPIAVEDILAYLVEAADARFRTIEIYEIGGPDRVSYGELMLEYARQKGLRRWIIPVPVLSLRLSSLWLGLVTPVYARIGRKLIESLRHASVVNDSKALRDFRVRPRGYRQAIQRALINEDRRFAETRWSDAISSAGVRSRFGGVKYGSRLVDYRSVIVSAPPERAFQPIVRIGGANGWYAANGLWALRGFLDLLVGGAGLRRGRRHPVELLPGDSLDFWRVESVEPPRLLRLRAEMKVPGRAWLQFEVEDLGDGRSAIHQTALFDPLGLTGLAYWYALYPTHRFVFRRMLEGIAARAEDLGNRRAKRSD
jgi:uncharacterized protein YbjT (DUF2867 family)/uncharacterized protein YndB with AHSA1/START domain